MGMGCKWYVSKHILHSSAWQFQGQLSSQAFKKAFFTWELPV